MDIKVTLKPGVTGTRKLSKQYGDQLVCVRHRYDKARRKHYKTVELIVEEKDWSPRVPLPEQRRVYVRIGYGESRLRDLIVQRGGCWCPDRKAWHLEPGCVHELGLEWRILDDELTP